MKKRILGFKEWTKYSVNCCSGCSNNCRYCYAKGMAVRFKQLKLEEWPLERVREKDVIKKQRLYDGRVMFPSSHDITLSNMDACLEVIADLLSAGNHLLIVSKPRIDCIDAICNKFQICKNRILFRFTIGAMDDGILAFWEPGAPTYMERKDSLMLAYDLGFGTSVSIEPMLEVGSVKDLMKDLEPFVSDAIWIGKMNHIEKNLKIADVETVEALKAVEAEQSDASIFEIFEQLKGHPLVKWKESIKKVVGLQIPEEEGLDI